jgi:predicted nucleic acid-binding Zn ribbon protein
MTENDEARAVYERFRRVFGARGPSRDERRRGARADAPSTPFGEGRDPHGLGELMDAFASERGWESPMAQAELIAAWSDIVGAETARHATPVGIEDGALTIQCDSTAWAQQLRLMRSQITTAIATRYPKAGVASIVFNGPVAPSWKRGPRSIPGRGPRDTYG